MATADPTTPMPASPRVEESSVRSPMFEKTASEAHREQYKALQREYNAILEDCHELKWRHAAAEDRVERVRMENSYLINQLCQYAPSDFESDLSDIEDDVPHPEGTTAGHTAAFVSSGLTKSLTDLAGPKASKKRGTPTAARKLSPANKRINRASNN